MTKEDRDGSPAALGTAPRRGVIIPAATGSLATFWQGIADGKLLLQHCLRCSHVWHPPTDACRVCQSFDFDWQQAGGSGTLYSYTVVHHPVHPVVAQWVPYTLCVVTLEEGPRILTTVEPDHGETLRIGEQLILGFRAVTAAFRLPVFRRDISARGASDEQGIDA
jgi:uncharacterized OB-fold protein